jgi:hypothetical protein
LQISKLYYVQATEYNVMKLGSILTQIMRICRDVVGLWIKFWLPKIKSFIDRCIKTFLDKTIPSIPKVPTLTVSKLLIPVVLPYTGNHAIQIRQQLNKLFSSAYPHIQLRVIFKPICRLSNFFHFKDRIPLNLRSHVVYQFKCQCCNALYLGKTCRHLHTRISEHRGISALTGNPLSCVSKSSISDHSKEAGHPVEPSDFKIITSDNSNHVFINHLSTSMSMSTLSVISFSLVKCYNLRYYPHR